MSTNDVRKFINILTESKNIKKIQKLEESAEVRKGSAELINEFLGHERFKLADTEQNDEAALEEDSSEEDLDENDEELDEAEMTAKQKKYFGKKSERGDADSDDKEVDEDKDEELDEAEMTAKQKKYFGKKGERGDDADSDDADSDDDDDDKEEVDEASKAYESQVARLQALSGIPVADLYEKDEEDLDEGDEELDEEKDEDLDEEKDEDLDEGDEELDEEKDEDLDEGDEELEETELNRMRELSGIPQKMVEKKDEDLDEKKNEDLDEENLNEAIPYWRDSPNSKKEYIGWAKNDPLRWLGVTDAMLEGLGIQYGIGADMKHGPAWFHKYEKKISELVDYIRQPWTDLQAKWKDISPEELTIHQRQAAFDAISMEDRLKSINLKKRVVDILFANKGKQVDEDEMTARTSAMHREAGKIASWMKKRKYVEVGDSVDDYLEGRKHKKIPGYDVGRLKKLVKNKLSKMVNLPKSEEKVNEIFDPPRDPPESKEEYAAIAKNDPKKWLKVTKDLTRLPPEYMPAWVAEVHMGLINGVYMDFLHGKIKPREIGNRVANIVFGGQDF